MVKSSKDERLRLMRLDLAPKAVEVEEEEVAGSGASIKRRFKI
jgi:hypothetical protein